MSVILSWLSRQVIWIGVICLFGAIGYSVSAIVAKRRRDTAQFSLEREVYQQRMARAGFVTLLFLMLAATVFTIRMYWAPTTSDDLTASPTPSSGLFTLTPGSTLPNPPLSASGTVTQPVATGGPVATGVIISAPESAGEPTPLPLSTAVPQAALQPDCPSPGAQLTFPAAGSDLSGVVEVLGTASVNAFSFYRFEVIFPGSETPNFVAQIDTSVDNGSLGFWDISDPTRYPPGGPYRFRLVVVDIYGNTTACVIPVNIVAAEE
ncbi:MAG: hypothetical protein MUF84_03070 [Anaerolineae bacterium]|jgi:hypothetical protein|nr:hypothetical protein [Anaerolineae bacterium]